MKYLSHLLMVFILLSASAFAEDPMKTLWTSFYKAAKEEKFDKPVKIYQVDAQCRKMCFIYNGAVYFFRNDKITRPIYAKGFNEDGINRISYEPSSSEAHGGFKLWSNEKLVITLGY